MASKNKIKKLKNSFSVKSWLKNKTIKLKRGGFFSASQRQKENLELLKEVEEFNKRLLTKIEDIQIKIR